MLDRICAVTRIFEAWSDERWVNDGAAVRVLVNAFGDAAQPTILNGVEVLAITADLADKGSKSGADLTLAEMYAANHERAGKVIDGDLSGLERRLAVQAASLDLLFNQLASRSVLNMGQHLDAAEKYMKLALKAQAQCRTTVEAIHLMHNPTQIIRQTNIAQGHQQVVNSGSAGKLETEQNKLLSADQQPAAQGMLYDLDSRKKAAAV